MSKRRSAAPDISTSSLFPSFQLSGIDSIKRKSWVYRERCGGIQNLDPALR